MKTYNNSVVLRNDGTDPSTNNDDMNAGVGVNITVRVASTPTAGQGALASIFDVADVAIANPMQTDSQGNYTFKVTDGLYDIVIAEGTADETILASEEIVELVTPDFINNLSLPYAFDTVADYKAFATAFPVGKVIQLKDRDAEFTVITGTGSANEFDVIANSTTSQSAEIVIKNNSISLKNLGAIDDGVEGDGLGSAATGTDNAPVIQAAQNLREIKKCNILVTRHNTGVYRFRATIFANTDSFSFKGERSDNIFESAAKLYFDPAGAEVVALRCLQPSPVFKSLFLDSVDRFAGFTLVSCSNADINNKQDVDAVFDKCTFRNFEDAVNIEGRGGLFYDCSFSVGRNALRLDWPAGFIPSGDAEKSLYLGMRGYSMHGCEYHAMNGHIIVNVGSNADNANNINVLGGNADTAVGVLKGSARDSTFSLSLTQGEIEVFDVGTGKLENVNVNGGLLMGQNAASGLAKGLNGVLLALNGSTIKNVSFNGVNIKEVDRTAFFIAGDVDGLNINGGVISELMLDNIASAANRRYLDINAATSVKNINIDGVVIDNANHANNPAELIHTLSGNLQNINISNVVYDSSIINLTPEPLVGYQYNIKHLLITGNGADPQIVYTGDRAIQSVIVTERFGGTIANDTYNATPNGTSSDPVEIQGGTNIRVRGVFNTASAVYQATIFF